MIVYPKDFRVKEPAYLVKYVKNQTGKDDSIYKPEISECFVVSVGRKYVGIALSETAQMAQRQFYNQSGTDSFLSEKGNSSIGRRRPKLFLTKMAAVEEIERQDILMNMGKDTEKFLRNPNVSIAALREMQRLMTNTNPTTYNIRSVMHGEYVATPIRNAFNCKTAYWLSKKGYTVALYMFTVEDCVSEKDFEDRLTGSGYAELEKLFREKFEDTSL